MSVFDKVKTFAKNLADLTKEKPTFDEIGYGRDSVLTDFLGEEKTTDSLKIKDYIKMQENDGEVQALMRILSLPIISAGWEIKEPEDGGEEETEFIRQNFENPPHLGGMTTPMHLIIADMTRAFAEGFRLYEKVWELRDGKVYLRKLAPRDSRTISLKADDKGGFAGAVQKVMIKGEYKEIEIPVYKCLLYTFQKDRDWLYGRSILKAAYYHYDKKHKLYYIAHKAAEVDTIPPKILYIGASISQNQKSAAEKAIDRIGVNTRVTLPDGVMRLEPYSPGGGGRVDIKELIDHHNNQMAKSVLAQFLDLGSERKQVGSYALSKEHSDLFVMGLEAEMKNIAAHINWYVIPQLIDWNFGSGKYPVFEFNPLADEVKQLLKETFISIVKGKTPVPDEFTKAIVRKVSDEMNLDIEEEEINEETQTQQEQSTEEQQTQEEKEFQDVPSRWGRPLRESERRIELDEIEDSLDDMEARLTALAQQIYYFEKKNILNQLRNALEKKDTALLDKIRTKLQNRYAQYLYNEALRLIETIKGTTSGELKVSPPKTPEETERMFKMMAQDIAQKEVQDLIWIAKKEVMKGIQDETLPKGEVMRKASQQMDNKFNENLDITASLVASISMNEARNIVFEKYSDRIYAFDYSAILDNRTCPICNELDGKIVAPDDPAYERFMPPIHPNCRCMWVAILQEEEDKPPITGIPQELEEQIKQFSDEATEENISFLFYWLGTIREIERIRAMSQPSEKELQRLFEIRKKLPAGLRAIVTDAIKEVESKLRNG